MQADQAEGDARTKAYARLEKAGIEMDTVAGAWGAESYVRACLDRIGVPEEKVVGEMSGGERRRVGIAAGVAGKADVMLMDEVTNELSIEGVQFVEEVVKDGVSCIVVTHDRGFVDRVCTDVWELGEGGEIWQCSGEDGWEGYLKQRVERMEMEDKELGVLRKAVGKELEWVRRMPKARGAKSKKRIEAYRDMERQMGQQKRRIKERNVAVKDLAVGDRRLGGEVVELEDVTVRRGGKDIVKDFSYTFQKGERVGIVGGNGAGKSTLLRAILTGEGIEEGIRNVGETVVFGHYEQGGIDITGGLSEAERVVLGVKGRDQVRVLDYVSELLAQYGAGGNAGRSGGVEAERELAARIEELSNSGAVDVSRRVNKVENPLAKLSAVALMDHFGMRRETQGTLVGRLSGGERRRLQLMELLLENPNFLLLDEVSNDLDIETLTMLEGLLLNYQGVICLVSHDRFMLDRLVNHLIVLHGDGSYSLLEGKFTEYLTAKRAAEEEERKMKREAAAIAAAKDRTEKDGQKQKARKLSYKERKEYEGLEMELEKYQTRYDELLDKLSNEAGQVGYEVVGEWSKELAEVEMEIERATERWMELAEIAGE